MRGGQIQVTPLLAATIVGWVALGATDIVIAIKGGPVIPLELHSLACAVLATLTVTGSLTVLLNRRAVQTPAETISDDSDDTAAIVRAVEVGRRLERRESAGTNVHAFSRSD